jgi:N-acetyl-gamma-glutamyl-phosphate reductase
LPLDRGILTTIYARPTVKMDEIILKELYSTFYANAPFVRLRKQEPAIKDVRGTNFCDLHVTYDKRTHMVIIISVIDNLIKGAAGQAVQNMNIMFGLEETTGLNLIPLNP